MKLSQREVLAYLERIGLVQPMAVDLVGLNTLICAQLTHIPFEALDVWGAGACPSLEVEDLYRKIVSDRRGGYCFELNTLFRALLNSLGFEAYQAIASLVDEDGVAAPPAHNVIICIIDGQKYFVDVGFGGPVPFSAMPLKEGIHESFRLEKRGAFWHVFRLTAEGEVNFIRFRDIPAEPCELIPLNFYISQKPDIHFRHILRVNLRKPDGVYSLVDHELTIYRDGQAVTKTVADKTDLARVLMEYYGIDIGKVNIQKEY